MGALKAKKTTKYKRSSRRLDHEDQCYCPKLVSLPRDMLMEILARVASASFTDLFNAKISCKEFLELAEEEDSIFQHVSLEKFSVFPWNISGEASSFLKRCKDCGNPESPLYRQGMISYFSYRMTEVGFEYLKKSAEKEHVEATYVNGIILLCSGDHDQSKQQQAGIKILSSLKAKSGRSRMKECRDKVRTMLWRSMWWFKNNSFGKQQVLSCSRKEPCKLQIKRNGWLSIDELVDEYDDILCETCRSNREVTWFYYMQHAWNWRLF
ncbi:putative F-box protein At1g67623 [Juglans regia]|uniref:F-box protein At1g67623 n=1 Tax=Juglans regia TaxID=51240 RepID=A0A6P9E441_JUGRE|nr:putative F-box protein At1g67623 [Juglans regia]